MKKLFIMVLVICQLTVAGQTYSVLTGQTPPSSSVTDNQKISLGMRFKSNTAGYITAARFYKVSGMGGTHTGQLWNTGESTSIDPLPPH